jgi:hypothetical protein
MRIGFAPAAREEAARAAASGFAPRMRWICPALCWAVRSAVGDLAGAPGGSGCDGDAIVVCGVVCGLWLRPRSGMVSCLVEVMCEFVREWRWSITPRGWGG